MKKALLALCQWAWLGVADRLSVGSISWATQKQNKRLKDGLHKNVYATNFLELGSGLKIIAGCCMCSSSSDLVRLHLLLRKSWNTESKNKDEELRERERTFLCEGLWRRKCCCWKVPLGTKGKYEAARGLQANPKPRGKTLGDLAMENREHKLKAKDFTRIT